MEVTVRIRRCTAVLIFGAGLWLTREEVSGQQPQPVPVQSGAPDWLRTYEFDQPFTFVRLKYEQPQGRWATDYPDAEINLSQRLREWTSLEIGSDGVVLDVTDARLEKYPFAYLSGNGIWQLSEAEVKSLREYLNQGGFLMIDDSWGEAERRNLLGQLKRVLPNRTPQELPLGHPVFHTVFDMDQKPQVCGIFYALQGKDTGVTWERADAKDVSYQAINDDQGRLMVLICHNTDLADGWERLNDNAWYAREFSEKRALPMAMNIIFYVLTKQRGA
ncbi:DUF4159 domain-containing protein [Roseiconus nitratireducens]|uniref:DUF4159 domain-containing protein n=1 Tax=Roseiconus nitratireducens TaxID=2605748 RepID=A0A5M6D304_9BACT|nr:DUF4159 domain-containing protein [Roseiconus nitratireducens]